MPDGGADDLLLFGYWRSSSAYRVRIALNLKGLRYRQQPVHLVRGGGEQGPEDVLVPPGECLFTPVYMGALLDALEDERAAAVAEARQLPNPILGGSLGRSEAVAGPEGETVWELELTLPLPSPGARGGAIAAAEAACAELEGRDAVQLLEFSASGLMQSLSVPVEKTGRILVLEDAVRSLGQAIRDGSA